MSKVTNIRAARQRLVMLDRQVIEDLAQAHLDQGHALIALLDRHDGDPDLETGNAEDEALSSPLAYLTGPGCPIADPDKAVDDEGCDPDEGV